MRAIKAVTPNFSLVLSFGLGFLSIFCVWMVILSLEILVLSLDISELLVEIFLLQDFLSLFLALPLNYYYYLIQIYFVE
jgi:hypothetical protein